MQTQAQSLRDKVRLSFEARKRNHQARLTFLQNAQILDADGNYNEKFFAKQTKTGQVRAK